MATWGQCGSYRQTALTIIQIRSLNLWALTHGTTWTWDHYNVCGHLPTNATRVDCRCCKYEKAVMSIYGLFLCAEDAEATHPAPGTKHASVPRHLLYQSTWNDLHLVFFQLIQTSSAVLLCWDSSASSEPQRVWLLLCVCLCPPRSPRHWQQVDTLTEGSLSLIDRLLVNYRLIWGILSFRRHEWDILI